MRPINHIIIHHTGTPTTATVESIRNYHIKVSGLIDVRYHYLIDGNGRIRLGRPEWQVGAHCAMHNGDSIGVAVIGNFEKAGLLLCQEEALMALLEDLMYRHPKADIRGHGELVNTLCPGRYLREWIEAWRYEPEAMGAKPLPAYNTRYTGIPPYQTGLIDAAMDHGIEVAPGKGAQA